MPVGFPNSLSGKPLPSRRISASFVTPLSTAYPAATTFPSLWLATALALASPPPPTANSALKPGSTDPPLSSRTIATLITPTSEALPAATSSSAPYGANARAAESLSAPTATCCVPPEPKPAASSDPSARKRAMPKSLPSAPSP
jgi:hypothetical protein